MRQLGSSLFDMLVGVGVLLGIPAAVLHPDPPVIAVAVAAVVLLIGRLVTERSAQRAKAKG